MFLTVLLILFAGTATGFGYLQKDATVAANPGDEVHFETYLFGTNESVKVTTSDIPASWRVNVAPERVRFPVTDGYRYMETGDGYRKAVPVRASLVIPEDAASGQHTITLVLTSSGTERDPEKGVMVRQLQDVQHTVTVHGGSETASPVKNKETGHTQEPVDTRSSGTGGMTITADGSDTGSSPDGNSSFWEHPVVLLILFEITWGIAFVYVLKRKELL